MTTPDSGDHRAWCGGGRIDRHGTRLGCDCKPDSEGRCPTADEAERFEHIDSLAPFCAKCCRHHGYVPPLPPAPVVLSLPLAQRILAALEDMGDMAMAKELRARIPR